MLGPTQQKDSRHKQNSGQDFSPTSDCINSRNFWRPIFTNVAWFATTASADISLSANSTVTLRIEHTCNLPDNKYTLSYPRQEQPDGPYRQRRKDKDRKSDNKVALINMVTSRSTQQFGPLQTASTSDIWNFLCRWDFSSPSTGAPLKQRRQQTIGQKVSNLCARKIRHITRGQIFSVVVFRHEKGVVEWIYPYWDINWWCRCIIWYISWSLLRKHASHEIFLFSWFHVQILLPRISYFAFAVTEVIEHFKDHIVDTPHTIWFSCGETALKGFGKNVTTPH
jgi:hypothetical protein